MPPAALNKQKYINSKLCLLSNDIESLHFFLEAINNEIKEIKIA